MGIEAFVMNYRDGEAKPISLDRIRNIFDTPGTVWNTEYNYLHALFHDPDDYVAIYCGRDALATGETKGLTIVRPIVHHDFLDRLYRVLQLDNAMLFYSDETTPVFHPSADPTQYPDDLLATLGSPRFANEPAELLHQT